MAVRYLTETPARIAHEQLSEHFQRMTGASRLPGIIKSCEYEMSYAEIVDLLADANVSVTQLLKAGVITKQQNTEGTGCMGYNIHMDVLGLIASGVKPSPA